MTKRHWLYLILVASVAINLLITGAVSARWFFRASARATDGLVGTRLTAGDSPAASNRCLKRR